MNNKLTLSKIHQNDSLSKILISGIIFLLRAKSNNLSEKSTKQIETDAAEDVPNTTRTKKQ